MSDDIQAFRGRPWTDKGEAAGNGQPAEPVPKTNEAQNQMQPIGTGAKSGLRFV